MKIRTIISSLLLAMVGSPAMAIDLYPEFDIGAQLDDVATSTPAENGYNFLRITPQRGLHINLRNQSGTEISTSSNPLVTKIIGATNGTEIGNVHDRLKVDMQLSSQTSTVPSWSKNLRYIDMNASSGGIARSTSIAASATWTTIYSYSGSGFVAGLIINVETFAGWEFRLLIDGEVIFDMLDSDITGDTVYDFDDFTDVNQAYLGISKGSHDRFLFHSPMNSPIYYSSSVQVQIRRPTAAAKKFQSGLMILSKET